MMDPVCRDVGETVTPQDAATVSLVDLLLQAIRLSKDQAIALAALNAELARYRVYRERTRGMGNQYKEMAMSPRRFADSIAREEGIE